jgi:hypothetical protein
MASADYDLRSSLHRRLGARTSEQRLREAEMEVLAAARSWGLGIRDAGHIDDLQLLTDLQHYGVPTRLIDFTSNPMTALWFACQEPAQSAGSRSGVLLALNVTHWPTHSSLGDPSFTSYADLENPVGATLQSALAATTPFLVKSARPNDRLRAQEGFFISSALPKQDMFRAASPFRSIDVSASRGDADQLSVRLLAERKRGAPGSLPFVAVIISASLKAKLLGYLETTYDRRAQVLFPDYEGFRSYSSALGALGLPGVGAG